MVFQGCVATARVEMRQDTVPRRSNDVIADVIAAPSSHHRFRAEDGQPGSYPAAKLRARNFGRAVPKSQLQPTS